MEGELLYNLKGEVPDDDDFVIPLGVADLKREGSDVSIITHGKMIHVALQAAQKLEKDGIEADVLDLRTIRPLDMDAILETVRRRTGSCTSRRAGPTPAPAPRSCR
jgi:pyruvate dehydrogenase E1 component beta subunit